MVTSPAARSTIFYPASLQVALDTLYRCRQSHLSSSTPLSLMPHRSSPPARTLATFHRRLPISDHTNPRTFSFYNFFSGIQGWPEFIHCRSLISDPAHSSPPMARFLFVLKHIYLSIYNWTIFVGWFQVVYLALNTLCDADHTAVYNAVERPLQLAAVLPRLSPDRRLHRSLSSRASPIGDAAEYFTFGPYKIDHSEVFYSTTLTYMIVNL